MNKKLLIAGASLGLLFGSVGTVLANSNLEQIQLERGGEKITLCHHTDNADHPFTVVQVSKFAAKQLLAQGDFLYLGQLGENGKLGRLAYLWCMKHQPTPSPSVTPTPSESPSPTPTATETPTTTVINEGDTNVLNEVPTTLPDVGGSGR